MNNHQAHETNGHIDRPRLAWDLSDDDAYGPAPPTRQESVTEELRRLRKDIEPVLGFFTTLGQTTEFQSLVKRYFQGGTLPAPPEQQYVSLDQIAAAVNLRKRSLEHYRKKMPAPRIQGRRGRRRGTASSGSAARTAGRRGRLRAARPNASLSES